MRRAALLLALAACRDPAAGHGSAAGSGSSGAAAGPGSAAAGSGSAAADPWAATTAPKPPDTPEARQKRAEAALGRVTTIEPEVARLRRLAFERAVPTK